VAGSQPVNPLAAALQRRQLACLLRHCRQQADLTQQQAAARLDWSTAKVQRIECGTVSVAVTDLRALLRCHGVTDPQLVEQAAELARGGGRLPWDAYRKALPPGVGDYLGLEAAATEIAGWRPTMLPGLVATEAYAEAIIRALADGRTGEQELRQRLQAWRLRQRAFAQSTAQVRLLLDEQILHRPVGGRQVMTEQLAHLAQVARRPGMQLRVLPLGAGGGMEAIGAYSLFTLPEVTGGQERLLFQQQPTGGMAVPRHHGALAWHHRHFDTLWQRGQDLVDAVARQDRTR
jgi:transcriptional regulator with XRE-family HTH domain